jgi:hypothetical protein
LIALLDACAIIYQVEAAAPFHARLAALLGSARASHPDLELAVSRLSWIECRALRERQTEALARYDAFRRGRPSIVEITAEIVDVATAVTRRIRAQDARRSPGPALTAARDAVRHQRPGFHAHSGPRRAADLSRTARRQPRAQALRRRSGARRSTFVRA